ncbi:MAG: hypothetical protein RLN60_00705 [Phycisphaerales bacterium]
MRPIDDVQCSIIIEICRLNHIPIRIWAIAKNMLCIRICSVIFEPGNGKIRCRLCADSDEIEVAVSVEINNVIEIVYVFGTGREQNLLRRELWISGSVVFEPAELALPGQHDVEVRIAIEVEQINTVE